MEVSGVEPRRDGTEKGLAFLEQNAPLGVSLGHSPKGK